MSDEPNGTYECPVCGMDSPHHHADPTRDARVAVLAHVIAGTHLGYHGMDKHGCRHAFQAMGRGVRREMWAVADRTLSELEATLRTRAEQAEVARALTAEAEVARLRGELGAALAEERAAVEAADALQREVAALRLMLREVGATNASGIDYALKLQADLAAETATRAALRTQESRIMGILADAGVPVGDVVEGVEALRRERDAALRELARAYGCVTRNKAPADPRQAAQGVIEEYRDVSHERDQFEEMAIQRGRWSRLWHSEARRLWREVQAMSAHLDDELGARTAMLALAHARRQVLETGYGHDVLDVARRAVEAVADAMLREGTP